MSVRLASHIWIGALRQRLEAAAVPFYILARGDREAGVIALIAARRDGQAALWMREYDIEAERQIWRVVAEGPAAEITARALRQREFDPDLWLIEVEADDLAPLIAEVEGI